METVKDQVCKDLDLLVVNIVSSIMMKYLTGFSFETMENKLKWIIEFKDVREEK